MNQMINGRWRGRAAACVGLLATAAAVHGQGNVFYVDDDAAPGGDGLSWATAFRDLQDALQAALPVGAPPRVVKIAQGVYLPDRGTGDSESTFRITSAATLLGGHAGVGTADPDQRDPMLLVSVLSGDLNRDDLLPFGNRSDNSSHVVTAVGDGHVLDGLTIEAGSAREGWWDQNGVGGGILVEGPGRPLITIRKCIVTRNEAGRGGGLGSRWDARALIEDSVFISNLATSNGGAVQLGEVVIVRSRILRNSAQEFGGGVFASGTVDALGSLFAANTARNGGGCSAENAFVRVINCTFSANRAVGGSCIHLSPQCGAHVRSSILDSDETGPLLSGACFNAFDVTSSFLRGAMSPDVLTSASTLCSCNYLDTSPRFADPLGLDGIAGTQDDDYRLLPNSPAIDAAWYDEQAFPDLLTGGDLAGQPRQHDDAGMPNIGIGADGALDIGAYEFQGTSCRADHDGDGTIVESDIVAFLIDWFAQRPEADFDRDRATEITDIMGFLTAWFTGCG